MNSVNTEPIKQKKLKKLPRNIAAAVIIVSNAVICGEKPDKAGPLAKELLAQYQCDVLQNSVVPENLEAIQNAIQQAIDAGVQFVLTCGGTGITLDDITPEATAPFLQLRLDAISWQIAAASLGQTPLASLSRGLVGITERGPLGVLIANSPGSSGGVKDTISVLGPLLPHIMEQLDPVKYELV